jgi:hypothetical protein
MRGGTTVLMEENRDGEYPRALEDVCPCSTPQSCRRATFLEKGSEQQRIGHVEDVELVRTTQSDRGLWRTRCQAMDSIIYLVGLIVIVMFILGALGLR